MLDVFIVVTSRLLLCGFLFADKAELVLPRAVCVWEPDVVLIKLVNLYLDCVTLACFSDETNQFVFGPRYFSEPFYNLYRNKFFKLQVCSFLTITQTRTITIQVCSFLTITQTRTITIQLEKRFRLLEARPPSTLLSSPP